VMEYVDGQPLHSLIEERRAMSRPGGIPCMPFALAWHYFAQLLGALAAVHSLGILHRDVKPANVLVRTDGMVKLTDFGIARIPSDEAQTSGGMAVGTGAYMAPEQVMGGDLDPRADLYAAAIVLYEALAGRTPFDRPERSELMVRAAQLEEVAQPLSQIVPGAPAVLDALFARALAKDRTQRYGSAIELGEAFRKSLGLPEHGGWLAEQRLAKSASALSAHQLEPSAEPALSPERAAELRTDVMRAFQS
jgi:eukaryotic-like serine/threonine-protein kinase